MWFIELDKGSDFYVIGEHPKALISAYFKYKDVVSACSKARIVGPNPQYTPRLLNLVAECRLYTAGVLVRF